MTTHQFPTGQIIKKDNLFYKILGEAGEVRFLSHGWSEESANEKNDYGLKDSERPRSSNYSTHELNAYGYVPVSPEESGLSEEWEPRTSNDIWIVDETPVHSTFLGTSWHRVLLKSGLLKKTKEEAERAYKEIMGE